MQVQIELSLKSSKEAAEVLQAIAPDNLPLPYGLSIDAHKNGNELIIKIHCLRDLRSLGATVEDMMSAIDLSLRTIQLIDETREEPV
ncbi:MAG: KEOPS complex subunit Pcc1 [Candidatus Thorarchaeota archaeon]